MKRFKKWLLGFTLLIVVLLTAIPFIIHSFFFHFEDWDSIDSVDALSWFPLCQTTTVGVMLPFQG